MQRRAVRVRRGDGQDVPEVCRHPLAYTSACLGAPSPEEYTAADIIYLSILSPRHLLRRLLLPRSPYLIVVMMRLMAMDVMVVLVLMMVNVALPIPKMVPTMWWRTLETSPLYQVELVSLAEATLRTLTKPPPV